jgi:serine/threonine protein kinase
MDRDRIIDRLRGITVAVNDTEYKLGRELGRGGNGVAFLCRSQGTNQIVAKIYIPPDSRDLDARALERFKNEIAITSRIKHAHVIPALGAASVSIGAYQLPFYLMPAATDTLRKEIMAGQDPNAVEKKLRLFLRAAFGVACLHSHGIIHRDLKPENILINRLGEPWIADLGIAHVSPGFVSVGLKTIESERLLNRDYYAPEQRFGPATDVDCRADIYALGCIFYELLTSIPPVRAHAPNLSVVAAAFAPFDSVWKRMTEWDPERRYQSIEQAIEDISFAMGTVLAVLKGTAGFRNPDLNTMLKLFRANNDVQRRKGIEIAVRLGKSAVSDIHAMLGHRRREVRNTAAQALGQILDVSSIPLLVAALYGNSEKPSYFRPAADTAADALSHFPEEERIRAIRLIERPIRPEQIVTVLSGVDHAIAYDAVVSLKERNLLVLDWSETELSFLVVIDEDRAWPAVQEFLKTANDFRSRHLISRLSAQRRRMMTRQWIEKGVEYRWYADDQIELLVKAEFPLQERNELLQLVENHIRASHWKGEDKATLLRKIQALRSHKRTAVPGPKRRTA